MQIHPPQVSRSRQGCPFTRARSLRPALPLLALCTTWGNPKRRLWYKNRSSMQAVSQLIPLPTQLGHAWWLSHTSVHAISATLQCNGDHRGNDFAEGGWATDLQTLMMKLPLRLWMVGQPVWRCLSWRDLGHTHQSAQLCAWPRFVRGPCQTVSSSLLRSAFTALHFVP